MSGTAYEEKDYWDGRYTTRWAERFEWYNITASQLHPLLIEAGIDRSKRLLDCGCGNSPLAAEFAASYGFTNVIGCDYSEICINALNNNTGKHPSVNYVLADCRELSKVVGQQSFDIVIDKATLDAISCGTEDDVASYVREVVEVLVIGGVLLVVTGGNPVDKRRDQLLNLSSGSLVLENTVVLSRDGPSAMTALVLRKV